MSPFKSEKQRRWMHKNKPGLAEEWEHEYVSKPRRERPVSKRSKKRKRRKVRHGS